MPAILGLWVTKSGLTASGRWLAITAAAFGLTMVGGTGVAFAGDLVGISPAKAVVSRAPMAVSVTFAKPLRSDGAQLLILTSAGDVGLGRVTTAAKTLRRQLRLGAPGGAYIVQWKAVSANGRRMSGSFTFAAARGNGEPKQLSTPFATPTATPEPTVSVDAAQTPSSTVLAAPVVVPPGPAAAERTVSSGFTVIPLAVGAILVLAAGLISMLNKPHLHA
jgi:methionine-rich copper-binding protein CopC